MRLEGKVALVTGGGTGIGAAVARRFASEGAGVVLLGRRREPLEEVASEVGGFAVSGDAASVEDANRAVAAAVERFGGLDVLVSCAGALTFGDALEIDVEMWERDLRSNLTTCMVTSRAALPAMLERGGGSIIILSSAAAVLGTPGFLTYTTAKTGLIGLMRSLAMDYGKRGVRANVVLPGLIRTAMSDQMMADIASSRGISMEEAYEKFTAVNALGRAADPSELAAVCLFLASPDSSFVTGSVLTADGGHTIANVGTAAFSD